MSEVASGGAPTSFSAAMAMADAAETPQSGPPTSVKNALSNGSDSPWGKADAKPMNDGLKFDPIRKDPSNERPGDDEDTAPQRRQPRETPRENAERKLMAKLANGQSKEVSEKELLDYYQRGESANKRFQEASSLKKQAEEAKSKAEALLRDPKALLAHLINDGDGVKSVHEAYQELTALAKMNPDQQQQYLRMRELENRDAELRSIEEAKQAEAAQAHEDAQIDQHLDGMESAFEAIGWEPGEKAEDLATLMFTNILEEVQESGEKGVTYRHIAQAVKGAIQETAHEWLSSASDDELAAAIGPKRLQAMMSGQVRNIQSKLPTQVDKAPGLPRERGGRFAEQPKHVVLPGGVRSLTAYLDSQR